MNKSFRLLGDVLESVRCLFRMFARLVGFAPGYALAVLLICAVSGLLAPAATLLTAQSARVIGFSGEKSARFILLIALVAAARLAGAVLAQISALFEAKITRKAAVPLKSEYYDTVTALGIRYRELPEFNNYAQIASLCTNERTLLRNMRSTMAIAAEFISALGSMAILAAAGWIYPALFLLLSTVAALLSFNANAERTRLTFESIDDVRRARCMSDSIREKANAAELRASHRSEWAVARWAALNETARAKMYACEMRSEKLSTFADVLYALGALGIAALYLFVGGGMGQADIVLFFGAITAVSAASSSIVHRFADLTFTGKGIRFYFKLMDHALPHVRGEEHNERPVGISARGMCFSYDGERNAVDNMNLEIRPGERVAIVGENGSGKTTLAKLILGTYEPTHGVIGFRDTDGIEMCFSRATAVLQDFCKYELRMRENIGMSDYVRMDDDDALLDAYRSVCGEELFNELDAVPSAGHYLFYNDVSKGRELSGGQWQRLALARAYLREAPLIVLDEPNAAIDAFAESAMIKRMFAMAENRTCVFITHRLTTTAMADRIIVMKEGRICEEGTHDDLMKLGGEYARMYKTQSGMYAQSG